MKYFWFNIREVNEDVIEDDDDNDDVRMGCCMSRDVLFFVVFFGIEGEEGRKRKVAGTNPSTASLLSSSLKGWRLKANPIWSCIQRQLI